MVHPLPGDTLAAVIDEASARIDVLSLEDGAIQRTLSVPFRSTGKQWTWQGDRAVFSLPGSPSLIGMWHAGNDSVAVLGMIPPEVMVSLPTYMQYGHLELIPWKDGFLAQVPTMPGLQKLDATGLVVGQVSLPVVRRRGQPTDLLSRHQEQEAAGKPFDYIGSAAATVGYLSTGELVVVQVDIDVENGPQRQEFTNLRYYVSLVTADLQQACADALVPFASDSPFPIPHLSGDTLVALARVVSPDDSVRTVVYRYAISSKGCRWIPGQG